MIQYTLSPDIVHLQAFFDFVFGRFAALFIALASFVVRFPISHPHPLSVFTIFGVIAIVRGTRMKMKDLWIAYARASCVARPIPNQELEFVFIANTFREEGKRTTYLLPTCSSDRPPQRPILPCLLLHRFLLRRECSWRISSQLPSIRSNLVWRNLE